MSLLFMYLADTWPSADVRVRNKSRRVVQHEKSFIGSYKYAYDAIKQVCYQGQTIAFILIDTKSPIGFYYNSSVQAGCTSIHQCP